MKKILGLVFFCFLFNYNAFAKSIKEFKIESIGIGDSALNYFNESEIEDSELDWFNYSYKEYSTSLVPGKGIYDWFKISYKSNDENFTIVGLVGIVIKKDYDDDQCNKELDNSSLSISKIFKNIKARKKQFFKVDYNPRKIFQEPDPSGKSNVISVSFDFKDEGKIILSCYNMDNVTNSIDSPIKDINQFDTFRIDIRSEVFNNYLKNN